MRTILEDLNYAATEPSSVAAAQAKKMGLAYVGFGRYVDPKTQQVTYIVQNDELIPFRKALKTSTYRGQQSDDIGNFVNALSPDVQVLNDNLVAAYTPANYSETELNALNAFTSQSYADINNMLSQLPAGISSRKIMPQSENDQLPGIIASMDAAIKKSRAPADFITYAKVGMDVAGNIQPGKSFKFKTFRSTTLNLGNVAMSNEDQISVLQIRIRKNAHGIYAANFSPTPEDCEFILPRGANIEVLNGPVKLVGSDAQLGGMNKQIMYFDCQTKS